MMIECDPGTHDLADAREKVTAFLKAGITTFIDLTEPRSYMIGIPLTPSTWPWRHRRPHTPETGEQVAWAQSWPTLSSSAMTNTKESSSV